MSVAFGRSGFPPAFGFPQTVTISGGVATVSGPGKIILQAESGTADQLDKIVGLVEGDRVTLIADSGDTITVAKGTYLGLLLNVVLTGNRTLELISLGSDLTVEETRKPHTLSLSKTISGGVITVDESTDGDAEEYIITVAKG